MVDCDTLRLKWCCTVQPDLVEQMQNPEANIVMENHEFGLPPAHYKQWPTLNETFDILTTTLDRKGVEYVSTIEHKEFPFFGTQVPVQPCFPRLCRTEQLLSSELALAACHSCNDASQLCVLSGALGQSCWLR